MTWRRLAMRDTHQRGQHRKYPCRHGECEENNLWINGYPCIIRYVIQRPLKTNKSRLKHRCQLVGLVSHSSDKGKETKNRVVIALVDKQLLHRRRRLAGWRARP